jgi:multiple sugar transport system permease protein
VLVYLKGFVDFELGRAAAIALLTMGIIFVLMLVYTKGLKWAESRQ